MVQILHEHSAPVRAKLFENEALHKKYDVIRAILRRRSDLLGYLAVPNVASDERQISWSTPINATTAPVPLTNLEPAERRQLLEQVQHLHNEMRRLEETFGDSPGAASAKSLMRSLADLPDEKNLYSVGGKPVFVYWSHEQENPCPELRFPTLERINSTEAILPAAQTGLPAAQAGREDGPADREIVYRDRDVVRTVYVTRGWLTFVGAVSFFGIMIASVLLAGLSLYYLVNVSA